jgi:hypothetical protein
MITERGALAVTTIEETPAWQDKKQLPFLKRPLSAAFNKHPRVRSRIFSAKTSPSVRISQFPP